MIEVATGVGVVDVFVESAEVWVVRSVERVRFWGRSDL